MKIDHEPLCQFIGDNTESHHPTCCQASIEGKSYCKDHVWKVYQEGTSVKPRKRSERRKNSIADLIDDFIAAADELEAEEI
jgi:hypothetical protein